MVHGESRVRRRETPAGSLPIPTTKPVLATFHTFCACETHADQSIQSGLEPFLRTRSDAVPGTFGNGGTSGVVLITAIPPDTFVKTHSWLCPYSSWNGATSGKLQPSRTRTTLA